MHIWLIVVDFCTSLKATNQSFFSLVHDKEDYDSLALMKQFLTNFGDLGYQMQRFVKDMTNNLQTWIKDLYATIPMDEYAKIELKYANFKSNLVELVNEMETYSLEEGGTSKSLETKIQKVRSLALNNHLEYRQAEHREANND